MAATPPDGSRTGSHPDLQQQPHSESSFPSRSDSNNYHWSLSLRPPLGEDASYLSGPNASLQVDVVTAQQHNAKLRPMLCAVFVACRVLRVSVETQFTAACLMHRYYWARENNAESATTTTTTVQPTDPKWIFAACLFLACKSEEEPRRLRDVINCAHMITWHHQHQPVAAPGQGDHHDRASFCENVTVNDPTETEIPACNKRQKVGENGSRSDNDIVSLLWNPHPPNLEDDNDDNALDNPQMHQTHADDTKHSSSPPTSTKKTPAATSSSYYWDAKASIIETEKLVLRWLAFDVAVSHPHRAVVWILQDLQKSTATQSSSSLTTAILASQSPSLSSSSFSSSSSSLFVSQLVVAAWKRLNNAIFSILALRHAVLPLACAAVQLATTNVDLETNHADHDNNLQQQQQQQQQQQSSSAKTSEVADVPKKFSYLCLEQGWSRRFGVDTESLFMAVRDLENSL